MDKRGEDLLSSFYDRKYEETKKKIEFYFNSDVELQYEPLVGGSLISMLAAIEIAKGKNVNPDDISVVEIESKLESFRGNRFNNFLINMAKRSIRFSITLGGSSN